MQRRNLRLSRMKIKYTANRAMNQLIPNGYSYDDEHLEKLEKLIRVVRIKVGNSEREREREL